MLPLVSLNTVPDNKAIKGLAVVVTITVGMMTIWYLTHQSKLTRLQIAKHMLENGNSIEKQKSLDADQTSNGIGRRTNGFPQAA